MRLREGTPLASERALSSLQPIMAICLSATAGPRIITAARYTKDGHRHSIHQQEFTNRRMSRFEVQLEVRSDRFSFTRRAGIGRIVA